MIPVRICQGEGPVNRLKLHRISLKLPQIADIFHFSPH